MVIGEGPHVGEVGGDGLGPLQWGSDGLDVVDA
jgi:hypothetical protein